MWSYLRTRKWAALVIATPLAVSALLFAGARTAGTQKPESDPNGPEVDKSLRSLLDALAGGPIEIKPAVQKRKLVSREQAVAAARRYGGANLEPKNVWQVTITDHEFMGGWVKDKPCWLLKFDIAPVIADLKELFDSLPMYVVIDGETGVFLEAFSEPRQAWWKRVKLKNAEVVKRFRAWGKESAPVKDPPKLPLLAALLAGKDSLPLEYLPDTQQIIIRHFQFTDRNMGLAVERIEGLEIVPKYENCAVWYISLEGVNQTPQAVSPEGQPVKGPNIEEVNLVISAVTGQVLSFGHYR